MLQPNRRPTYKGIHCTRNITFERLSRTNSFISSRWILSAIISQQEATRQSALLPLSARLYLKKERKKKSRTNVCHFPIVKKGKVGVVKNLQCGQAPLLSMECGTIPRIVQAMEFKSTVDLLKIPLLEYCYEGVVTLAPRLVSPFLLSW